MSLLICNGSPRGTKGNSNRMITWFSTPQDTVINLNKTKQFDSYIEHLSEQDKIVIIYPLYVDAMPGLVMEFFEKLYANKDLCSGKDFLFILHCGFPEHNHLLNMVDYHKTLVNKLGGNSAETIMTPGSEGVRLMPDSMNKKRKEGLENLIQSFRNNESLNHEILVKLAGYRKPSKLRIFMFKVFSLTGLTNIYWNNQLKKNKVYKERFAKPYEV